MGLPSGSPFRLAIRVLNGPLIWGWKDNREGKGIFRLPLNINAKAILILESTRSKFSEAPSKGLFMGISFMSTSG